MALSITVNGAGTFTASMEEGPVSFTASLAAVGPQGPAGATGPAGVVAASAPITYNAGTQTVGISATPTFTSVGFSSPGSAVTINAEYYIPFSATYDTAGMEYRGDKVVFPDNTEQVTAFVGEARKVYITARNNTGSAIAKGKVVRLSGATGNKPTIALAQADTEANSSRTIGITAEEIGDNSDGKVIISGAVENIDTSAFNAGDTVHLSSSVAGGLQTALPTQPLHGVVVGIVTRANPSVGSIEVAINNYQELEELSDVLISGEANNDLLAWDSTASVWKNRTFSALGLLTSSTAASTYAPLASPTFTGTVTIPAGASISGFAPLASPALTGTPTAPTAAASTNTTQIATTAFVQQEVPAASTTAAGKVELATVSESYTGTSESLAITPKGLNADIMNPLVFQSLAAWYSAASSGTGGLTQAAPSVLNIQAATSAGTGYYLLRFVPATNGVFGIGLGRSQFPFSKRVQASFLLMRYNNRIDANTTFRATIGKISTDNAGDLARAGIGIRWVTNGNIELQVHDGTNLTNVSTSTTLSNDTSAEITIDSDGAGNVTLYIDGTSVATTTAGPTANTAFQTGVWQFEVQNTATPTNQFAVQATYPRVKVGR